MGPTRPPVNPSRRRVAEDLAHALDQRVAATDPLRLLGHRVDTRRNLNDPGGGTLDGARILLGDPVVVLNELRDAGETNFDPFKRVPDPDVRHAPEPTTTKDEAGSSPSSCPLPGLTGCAGSLHHSAGPRARE